MQMSHNINITAKANKFTKTNVFSQSGDSLVIETNQSGFPEFLIARTSGGGAATLARYKFQMGTHGSLNIFDNQGGGVYRYITFVKSGGVNFGDETSATNKGEIDATLVKQGGNALMPAGSLIWYAGSTAPSGFYLCDGTTFSRTGDARLFAAIGTTYGAGDGSTTANLPNLVTNNRFIRAAGGSLSVGQTQNDEIKSHAHTLTVPISTGGQPGSSSGTNNVWRDTTISSTATAGGSETRPHNIALLPLIKR